MRIESLEHFVVFAEYRNYSRAASHIGISQPALSSSIAQMEKEVGFSLVKHGQSPALTPAGAKFASEAEALIKQYRKALKECEALARNAAEVLVLERPICTTAIRVELDRLIAIFKQDEPSITVRIHRSTQDTLENSLKRHKADMGFIYSRPEFIKEDIDNTLFGFTRLPLSASMNVGFWMHSEHPLAKKDSIDSPDLQNQKVLLPANARYKVFENSFKRCMQAANIFPEIIHRGDNMRDVISSLASDELVIMNADQNDKTAQPTPAPLVFRPFNGSAWNTYCYLIYRLDNNKSALEKFLDFLDTANERGR